MELPFNTTQPTENKPVTVLGRTFASDEERRTYFREELRKQLPELKKIDGFPILYWVSQHAAFLIIERRPGMKKPGMR